MQSEKKALVQFHIAVVLWGFTAILGDLIALPAISLVWWRVAISGLVLAFMLLLLSRHLRITRRIVFIFTAIGGVVGLHWLCFYGSIKLANASIALITMSTSALFTVLIEAMIGMRRISSRDLWFGFAIVPLMVIVAGGMDSNMNTGFVVGLASALFLALFTVLNKRFVHLARPTVVTMFEMGGAWVLLGLAMLAMSVFDATPLIEPAQKDWILLLILSIGCTVLPFVLSLYALKHLSAFTTNFIFNLEPVYGIILAALILKDYRDLQPGFYIGAVLIVALVLIYPFTKGGSGLVQNA